MLVQNKGNLNKKADIALELDEEIILVEVSESFSDEVEDFDKVVESFSREIASMDISEDELPEEITLITQEQDHLLAEHFIEKDDNSLVLAFGGKGGNLFYQSVNTPMTLRSATVASDKQLLDESDKILFQQNIYKDNIAEMEHDQPVSFGVTVSKSIIDGFI